MKRLLFLFGSLLAVGLSPDANAARFASEYELLRQLPTAALSGMVTNTGQPDAQGFVGFPQRGCGGYEAGMRRGGCWILIGAVVAGNEKRADLAWTSIEATFA